MSSKRIYNMVLKATDVCPEGELLTDKELERMKLNNVKRGRPETSKVKVYGEDVYFNFGVRFAESYELIEPGEYEQRENLYRYILARQSATEEWWLLYDKGISICVASRSNKTSREICS